ncbi:MAG: DUF2382 domain-containing protein [Chloroflexi bacterium]|nr:DUF2382 domain-containing protein [Chloroflexota bacterium]
MNTDEHRALPLEGQLERMPDGWFIRLPVRKEDVRVEKRVVVYEEVDIRREYVEDVVHVDEQVRREELDVRPRGNVEANQDSPLQGGRRQWH